MSNQDKGTVVKLRRVVKCGSSFYIALPQEFVKRFDIQKGEKLPVLSNHILKIVPMKEQ